MGGCTWAVKSIVILTLMWSYKILKAFASKQKLYVTLGSKKIKNVFKSSSTSVTVHKVNRSINCIGKDASFNF